MNEEQYKQVCEACDQVLNLPGSTLECMSIPWLHVIREHPSFLKDYEGLFTSPSAFGDVARDMAAKGRAFAGWFRQLWRALRSNGAPWHASQSLSGPVDVLFVSHLLNDADAGKAADFYFGTLPELVRADGYRVVVALIDHTGSSDMLRVQRWDGNAISRVLFSDTLNFRGELSLYRRLRRESSRLASLSRQQGTGFLKKVFAHASLEAMSGGARSTLRMSVQVSRLVATIKPKMMIITYEGHAWERVAFSAAREASDGLQCVGYQHAAIFKLQHGALRNLGSPFDPDLILTAGAVSKAQIENSGKAQGIPVRVLGSNRAFSASGSSDSSLRTHGAGPGPNGVFVDACLVLPEGLVSECLLLFEFSLNCAKLMPEMRFIWRLHPLVRFESLIAQNPKLRKLPRNVELSTATMEDDLARATYALYRGSTAIVKAVCANVRPVYLALPDEMTVDPLYQLGSWREIVKNPEQFSSIVYGHSTGIKALEDQASAIQYCGNFYMPVDPSIVVEILKLRGKKVTMAPIDPPAQL